MAFKYFTYFTVAIQIREPEGRQGDQHAVRRHLQRAEVAVGRRLVSHVLGPAVARVSAATRK